MPKYNYTDAFGHTTESRQGVDCVSIPCPICGSVADRQQVYLEQYMQAETGPSGGKRNPIPRDEIRLGQDVAEYEEAAGEMNYQHEKAGTKPPDLMKIAKQRVKNLKVAYAKSE